MKNQDEVFYKALLTRDPRFDGKFFVAVKTTGIYCRPICPAKPKKENVEFFTSAVLAEKAGYRPCLRCRPESAPASPAWIGKSAVVSRALKLIAQRQLTEKNEDEFAALLGVSARHLRRLFQDEIGLTPKQIADNQRLDFARKLITETSISVTEVSFSAGFSSIRRFNDAFKERFKRAPSELRKKQTPTKNAGVVLNLSYRPPLDWPSLLAFYRGHHIFGIETVTDIYYERIFKFQNSLGVVRVQHSDTKSALQVQITVDEPQALFPIAQRVRKMFDLDSDPILVANSFAESKLLQNLVEKHPGLRLPKGWDAFEILICTILGQLVSTEQATRLVRQLVSEYGEKITHPLTGEDAYLFPAPEKIAKSTLSKIGTTGARKNTIRALAKAVADKKISLESTQDLEEIRKILLAIKGVGPWTAEYVCMRALEDADAFPGSDLILQRVTEKYSDLEIEKIRPWRAYAAMYLWKEFAQTLSNKRGE